MPPAPTNVKDRFWVAGKASFTEEVVCSMNCDDGFLALLRNDSDLHLEVAHGPLELVGGGDRVLRGIRLHQYAWAGNRQDCQTDATAVHGRYSRLAEVGQRRFPANPIIPRR
jgi:hypothetical protein